MPGGSSSDAEHSRSSTPSLTRPYSPASSRSLGSSVTDGIAEISASGSPQSSTGTLITRESPSKIMEREFSPWNRSTSRMQTGSGRTVSPLNFPAPDTTALPHRRGDGPGSRCHARPPRLSFGFAGVHRQRPRRRLDQAWAAASAGIAAKARCVYSCAARGARGEGRGKDKSHRCLLSPEYNPESAAPW